METNRSALTRLAFATRAPRGTNQSPSRVSMARKAGSAWVSSKSRCAIMSVTSFSIVPPGPIAPGSSPPWPGSMAIVMGRSSRSGRADRSRRSIWSARSGAVSSCLIKASRPGSFDGRRSMSDASGSGASRGIRSMTNRCWYGSVGSSAKTSARVSA